MNDQFIEPWSFKYRGVNPHQNHRKRELHNLTELFLDNLEDIIEINSDINKIGLTIRELRSLPKDKIGNVTYNDICSICYAEFKENEEVYILRCKHIFHVVCAKMWLSQNAKCPNCKTLQTDRPIFNLN